MPEDRTPVLMAAGPCVTSFPTFVDAARTFAGTGGGFRGSFEHRCQRDDFPMHATADFRDHDRPPVQRVATALAGFFLSLSLVLGVSLSLVAFSPDLLGDLAVQVLEIVDPGVTRLAD